MKALGRVACFITVLLLYGIFSCFCLVNHRNNQQAKIARILKSIKAEDRFHLEFYFRHLLFEDPLAYVIYGDKPMAFSGFWNPKISSGDSLMPSCSSRSIMLRKGYELHKKYQRLFQSKNLIFVFRESDDFTEIALVNRRNFLKTVAGAIEDFQKVLGVETSGEDILNQFIKEREILAKPLRENHALLGILLGYGKKNSATFHRKIEIMKSQKEFHLQAEKKALTPSIGFDSLDEELTSLNKRLLALQDPYQELSLVELPTFMVDPYDLETQEVRLKFVKQRKNIIDIYRQGNFLEITLNHFASSDSPRISP